jgi:leucyl-tRNA synthetase
LFPKRQYRGDDVPSYNPKVIEPRWQRYWEEHKTFRADDDSAKPKHYVLDMFPYPSGAGLHVGHPEGYTATDVLARYQRMRGVEVLHPMGWDAFGLPAEQYAIETGTHPRVTTERNVDTFRRQIKRLGFSYDWDREVDTTDPSYVKWTQWIFLLLFDTWYDEGEKRGRPIAELPIPPEVRAQGERAVRHYQDGRRLAYQAEVAVNWCPELGTVLANEEVVDGKSERGGYPVVRMPLRQWMLRITAYAERLLTDLDEVDWSQAIKDMQRNWIGRSEGAEVEFALARPPAAPTKSIRIFTTRPDTLFGATYMVLSPEHPLVNTITTDAQRAAVQAYQAQAARKSDLERTDLAKKKTGVFTGAHAVNPVNQERIPIWIADYVLISYGTGAIMAVPGHDDRDWEFAKEFGLPIRAVVQPPADWLRATSVYKALESMEEGSDVALEVGPDAGGRKPTATMPRETVALLAEATKAWERSGRDRDRTVQGLHRERLELFDEPFTGEGVAINSGALTGQESAAVRRNITAWLAERGLGAAKTNYKLRDWLFSRQRYWGEPFPILHEVDAEGHETGLVEPLSLEELPLRLPELEDYKPSGEPEPPLGKARDWLWVSRNGRRYRRETNTMPQWAGSCWYYLRYLDPHNDAAFCAPEKERRWMPVDLYVGGAEHAVLHLLYARFWHKVLFDYGHVHNPEPFQRLVNQGMILGEMEFTGFKKDGTWVSVARVDADTATDREKGAVLERVRVDEEDVEKHGDAFVLKGQPEIKVDARAYKMSKSRGNVINPDEVIDQYGADSMRLYEMFMGPLEATKPWSMRGVEGVYRFLGRVWRLIIDDRADDMRLADSVKEIEPDADTRRKLHQTIQKVTEDLAGMRFNTAIAAMMELSNHLTRLPERPRSTLQTLVLLLSPFAPHIGEELWQALDHRRTLAYEPWPVYDEAQTRADQIEVPVQVNGKVRSRITVPTGADEATLRTLAMKDDRIAALVNGKQVVKVIVVPGKLVNIVVK